MNTLKKFQLKKISVNIEKHQILELNPDNFDEFLSIRNPAAFIHNKKIGLLYTVRHKPQKNENTKSYLHLAWSKNGKKFKLDKTPFIGLDSNAQCAVEDARIEKIQDTYYITFTAYKGYENFTNTTRIGLVTTKDFKKIEQREIILDWKKNNKNALIFPNGQDDFYVIDRPFHGGSVKDETPSAEIGKLSKDRKTYTNLGSIIGPRTGYWDAKRVGINTPPIKTNLGNLFLYHGVEEENNIYNMGIIITDPSDPQKILYRSERPIITPTENFETGQGEMKAEVPNVIFGCGIVPIRNKKNEQILRFYYSGADKYPAYADIHIAINNKPLEIISKTFNL